jgi:hypothetical protein
MQNHVQNHDGGLGSVLEMQSGNGYSSYNTCQVNLASKVTSRTHFNDGIGDGRSMNLQAQEDVAVVINALFLGKGPLGSTR